MSRSRPSPFEGMPPEEPQEPQMGQQPAGSSEPYPALPTHQPGELPAQPAHAPYGAEGPATEEDEAFARQWAASTPENPQLTDEGFLDNWTAELNSRDPDAATAAEPATGEAAAADPDKKDTRAFRRTKTGKRWLAGIALAGAVGFGGAAIADQVVERDGIFATDSRETGESFIQFEETVAKPAQYVAEGMLAVGGLVVGGRMLASATRGTKRGVSKAYRKVVPKRDKPQAEGDSSDSAS